MSRSLFARDRVVTRRLPTLRNVAASVRNAASLAGSLTLECSTTLRGARSGSLAVVRYRPGRRARCGGRAARPRARQSRRGYRGDAAADKGFAPGDAGLVERADRDGAHAAGRRQRGQPQRFAAAPGKAPRGEPAEFVHRQLLAAAPAAFLPHHHGVEVAGVVGIDDRARKADRHLKRQLRRHRVQPLQQRHQFGSACMIADPERQGLLRRLVTRQRAVMRFDQRARMMQECGAVGGQSHRPRRALDQPLADHSLQPLQLHADGGLRRAERLGGAGEALQLGDQQEGLHGIDVQGAHVIITNRYHCYERR